MTRVAIALGSNLGDRVSHLDFAVSRLRAILNPLRISSWYETQPIGVAVDQPLYLNGAVAGDTDLAARPLLEALLSIERARGRERPFPGAARTLDIDLILHGDTVVEEPGLVVPHPRFRERRFVLEPLAEIAPDMRDPVTRHSIAELLHLII